MTVILWPSLKRGDRPLVRLTATQKTCQGSKVTKVALAFVLAKLKIPIYPFFFFFVATLLIRVAGQLEPHPGVLARDASDTLDSLSADHTSSKDKQEFSLTFIPQKHFFDFSENNGFGM